MGDESLARIPTSTGITNIWRCTIYAQRYGVEHRISSGMGDESLGSLLPELLTSGGVLFTLSAMEHRISSGMGDESLGSLVPGLLTSGGVLFTLSASMEHRISSGMGDESLGSLLPGLLLLTPKIKKRKI